MRCYELISIVFILQVKNSLAHSIRAKIQDSTDNELEQQYLWRLFGAITRSKENTPFSSRKYSRVNDQNIYLYNTLSSTVDVEAIKNWLRHEASGQVQEAPLKNSRDELASLVETELLNVLAKKSSALLNKPFVQKKGRNDFLVLRPDPTDPFVTVVPNDIYYNVEKKCVNWMDDCNQKGLRGRLLQKVHGPYK